MKHTTLIDPGLWAGPWRSTDELLELEGLEVVVSCLPIGTRACDRSASDIRGKLAHVARWEPGRELRHRIMVTSDTDAGIPCEHIAHVLGDPAPTLIHCNAGQNRSTAMAACWLLLHREAKRDPHAVLLYVSGKRGFDLGQTPKVYAQMEATVHRFAGWLKARA